MSDFADKVEGVLGKGTEKSRDAADEAREKLGSNTSNPDEETINEKSGRAHLDHNANDDKFGGND